MKEKTIGDLGPRQLWKLRNDIIINSVYLHHYENRYGVDPQEVCDFFKGWLEYLEEEMREDYPEYHSGIFWAIFPKYDTPKNLLNWWFCWMG